MPSVSLKTKGTTLLLCLISFTLGLFLNSFPSYGNRFFPVERQVNVAPVSRVVSENTRKGHLANETEIGAPTPDLMIRSGKSPVVGPSLFEDDDNKKDKEVVVYADTPISNKNDSHVNDKVTFDNKSAPIKNGQTKTVNKAQSLLRTGGRYSITATQLLNKAIGFISPDVRASFANKTGMKYDKSKSAIMWSNTMNAQKKWAVLKDGMRQLGYEQRLPTIICLGLKKAGTTAFLYYLVKHPQISRALLDEVHYFSIDYGRGIDYYRSRMGFSTAMMLQFEKSPSYFVFDDVPQRMLKDLPASVKFVVCVRDPLERTISDFRHEYELKLNRKRSRAAGETPVTQAKHFVETIIDSNDRVDPSSGFIIESLYSKHFKNWLKSFPRDRFYILSQERVKKDLYTELKNVEKFLDLEPFYERSMFYYNEQRHAPCMHSGCPPTSTPGFLPKAALSPAILRKLRDFFRPYNREFEELTQMNFSWTNL
ncbi:heparan sulfate glucosamine 3-O-sulfotransferase 5-like [Acanthaster planci]|uniref:Heparan sulfate glucosamine 3-O-sulfotransferase 5-like n=1 Tax=Acanthaster planci TaxID=133434 RepID=A0A8B7YCQ3_ACAPL|nr:heparan sulfate glucosamine 3-O-sulfotransferase 5-like [Acanthaster planci]